MINIIQLWKNKGQIIEGIKNNIFRREDVEKIAEERLNICKNCDLYTVSNGCMIPGTQPCCNKDLGGCGCSLELKTRSLSSACPLETPKWKAVLSEEEEDTLKQKLGI